MDASPGVQLKVHPSWSSMSLPIESTAGVSVEVRHGCFARGPVEGAPVVLDEPSDREHGRCVRKHKHSCFCAERLDVNVDDVRRLNNAVGVS